MQMQILLKFGFLPLQWVLCSRTYTVHSLLLWFPIGSKCTDQRSGWHFINLCSLFSMFLSPDLIRSQEKGRKQHQQLLSAVKHLFFPSFLVKQTSANWLLSPHFMRMIKIFLTSTSDRDTSSSLQQMSWCIILVLSDCDRHSLAVSVSCGVNPVLALHWSTFQLPVKTNLSPA